MILVDPRAVGKRLRPPEDHVHGDGGDTPVALLGGADDQPPSTIDVVALGHPLVDVLAHETDDVSSVRRSSGA